MLCKLFSLGRCPLYVVPVAVACLSKARSYSKQASPGDSRAVSIIRGLYFVKLGHRWGWVEHITIWKIVKALVHVKMSSISNTKHLFETSNLPSRKIYGSCLMEWRLADNKSAKSMKWLQVILDTSLTGVGAWLGPTTKALSKEGMKMGLSKPENMLVTWVPITEEVNVARDELMSR